MIYKQVYINNQETQYLIYDDGRLFNKASSKWLKGTVHGNYLVYTMRHNNKTYMERAHRLVAQHFLENPNNLPIVHHINGDTFDNHVKNLQWADYTENSVQYHPRNKEYNISYIEEAGEQWKNFRNSFYLVSNTGKVKNGKTQKLLRGMIDNYGYVYYHLRGNVQHNCLAHRLVWECFGGNFIDGYVINHKDGNKINNHIDNLEQITYKENTQHYLTKINPSISTIVYQYDLCGNYIQKFDSINECARQLGIDSRHLSNKLKRNHGNGGKYNNFFFSTKPDATFPKYIQYTLDGQQVRIWYSISEIVKETGFSRNNISLCLNGHYKTAYGFKWKKCRRSTTNSYFNETGEIYNFID